MATYDQTRRWALYSTVGNGLGSVSRLQGSTFSSNGGVRSNYYHRKPRRYLPCPFRVPYGTCSVQPTPLFPDTTRHNLSVFRFQVAFYHKRRKPLLASGRSVVGGT